MTLIYIVQVILSDVGVLLLELTASHQDKRALITGLIDRPFLKILTSNYSKVVRGLVVHQLLLMGLGGVRLTSLTLLLEERNGLLGQKMHIFQVTAQVTALGESLFTLWASVGSEARVLSEMVPQVAALFKD